MATVILDKSLAERLKAERAAAGGDRYDEVWEGTYMMAPMPNNEHQEVVNGLAAVLQIVITWPQLGHVYPGANISDRLDNWDHNYRVPDIAVFLSNTSAVDHGSFWLGGPDFAVEVISPGDQTREKLEFYARVGTRELLVIDRDPWQLELYRLTDGSLDRVPAAVDLVNSDVTDLKFQLQPPSSGEGRPRLEVTHSGTNQSWTI